MVGILAAPAISERQSRTRSGERAFSLIDVLVTLAVISILIGLLLPTLSGVRETTRQLVCRSNTRQLGFGLALYADDYRDRLPLTIFTTTGELQRTTQVRRDTFPASWDGIGYLYSQEYLTAPGVFYCPSHSGSHPLNVYASRWPLSPAEALPSLREITTNFQYRGATVHGINTMTQLALRHPRAALIADALRTRDEYNHKVGTNVLRVDLSVTWYPDPSGRLSDSLPAGESDPAAAAKVSGAWDELDAPTAPPNP